MSSAKQDERVQDEKRPANFLAASRISPARAREFLLALANLREDGATSFLQRFGGFLFPSEKQQRERELETLSVQGQFKGWTSPPTFTVDAANPEKISRARWYFLERLQAGLREAWGRPAWEAEWHVAELRYSFWHAVAIDSKLKLDRTTVPPYTWLMQATSYLLKKGSLAKICENPGCTIQRFYFATRGRQIYCSDVCARPAIRAAKLRSWRRNREKWPSYKKRQPKKGKRK